MCGCSRPPQLLLQALQWEFLLIFHNPLLHLLHEHFCLQPHLTEEQEQCLQEALQPLGGACLKQLFSRTGICSEKLQFRYGIKLHGFVQEFHPPGIVLARCPSFNSNKQ